jgi:hypothetical protein
MRQNSRDDSLPTNAVRSAELKLFTFMQNWSHTTWAVEIILCTDAEYSYLYI